MEKPVIKIDDGLFAKTILYQLIFFFHLVRVNRVHESGIGIALI